MKQFYKRYLVPVVAALISLTFMSIITMPIQHLRKWGVKDFNMYFGMLGGYIGYLIYGVCMGATLFIMWFMFRGYSKKKRFWCYLVIGLVFWIISLLLPFSAQIFGILIIKIYTNVRAILPIVGATLMVLSPMHFIKKGSVIPPFDS